MRLILIFIGTSILSHYSISQCSGFPATLAESNCGSGTPLVNGANINSGDNYTFCGTTSSSISFNSVNLAGGNLTLCGNATITSGNWNSGTIIISCGSTVTFSSNLTLSSNVKIVNYGRVNINGTLDFQNNDNCFYNETANSSLYVTGDIVWPQNASDRSYLKNNGYISVGGTVNARNGVYYCASDGSILQTANLTYGTGCGAPANRFSFSSGSGRAIIALSGTATLNGTLTSSAHYSVNRGASSTVNAGCGSWGSAVVATNSPSFSIPSSPGPCAANPTGCFTALPVSLVSFEAIADEDVVHLYWSTESEKNNSHFTVERSEEGLNWEAVTKTLSQGDGAALRHYTETDFSPLRGTSYYRLAQTDHDGTKSFSEIRSVVVRSGSFVMYPNPANDKLNLLPAASLPIVSVALRDASGRTVLAQSFDDYQKGEMLALNIEMLPAGVYLVSAELSNGDTERQRLIVE